MSCDLSLGRVEPCKNKTGGLKAAYFINYDADLTIAYDSTDTDVIEQLVASADTVSAFKYDLQADANSLEQTINSSRENGTTYFEQALNLTLKGLSKEDHKELKILCYGRPKVVVEDRNGNLFICGLNHGMEVTGGTVVTGGAQGDLSGYTLVLTGMEAVPANFCIPNSGTTVAQKLTNLGLTVVEGS